MDASVEALKDWVGIAANTCSTSDLSNAGWRDLVPLGEFSGARSPAFDRHHNGQKASGADVIGN